MPRTYPARWRRWRAIGRAWRSRRRWPKHDLLLDEWQRLLNEGATPIRIARPGDQLDLDGATLRILAIGDGGEAGLVMRLDYGATSVVFDHVGGAPMRRLC